jgi:hypothetical protein
MIKTLSLAVLLTVTTFMLQGCAPSLRSSVTSFHDYGTGNPVPRGPVYISGSDSEQKIYAQRVQAGFQKHGFFQAANKGNAIYIATVSVSRDSGRDVEISSPIVAPVGGGIAVQDTVVYGGRRGRRYYSTTYYEPTQYAVVGSRNYNITVYKCKANVKLLTKGGKLIWEGRAVTDVQTSELYQVAPAMIDAILKDFPAVSGKTRVVSTSL